MTPCATTLKGNGHDSILVPFILLSASALYIANAANKNLNKLLTFCFPILFPTSKLFYLYISKVITGNSFIN